MCCCPLLEWTNQKKSEDERKGGQAARKALSGLDGQREEGLLKLIPVQ